ncbi:MAG: hypothetical protein ACJAYU_000287 [Bradymonadia bacterium]
MFDPRKATVSPDRIQTNTGQSAPAPPVEVSPSELLETVMRTGTRAGSSIVDPAADTLLASPSGLLKTANGSSALQDDQSYTVRWALIIAATLLAASALLSFLKSGH